jgi:hypothetical protein
LLVSHLRLLPLLHHLRGEHTRDEHNVFRLTKARIRELVMQVMSNLITMMMGLRTRRILSSHLGVHALTFAEVIQHHALRYYVMMTILLN